MWPVQPVGISMLRLFSVLQHPELQNTIDYLLLTRVFLLLFSQLFCFL